jgi:hypothetical protein
VGKEQHHGDDLIIQVVHLQCIDDLIIQVVHLQCV